MGITIGRLGLDVSARDPQTTSIRSDGSLRVSGQLNGDSVDDVESLVQQALGYPSVGEPFVPATFSHNQRLDGIYGVTDVEVELIPGLSPPVGAWYAVRVDLRRVREASQQTLAEEQCSGAVRSNDHSIVSSGSTPWHAVPSTADGYRIPGVAAGAAFTRTGSTGAVKVYTPAAQALYDAFPIYRLAPADWYDMSPTVTIDGYPVVGSHHPNRPAHWLIDNGLLQVRPGAACLLELRRWIPGAPGAWGSWVGVEVGHVAAGPTWDEAPTASTTVRVERSSPVEAVLVLELVDTVASSPVGFRVALRLRRGARLVRCQIDVDTALAVGVRPDSTGARTDITGAVHLTAANADGDRLVFCVPQAYDSTSGTMTTSLSTPGTHMDVGIGLEVDGSSSTEPDRVADLKAQYYAGQALILRLA